MPQKLPVKIKVERPDPRPEVPAEADNKTPFYKQWWFWALVLVIVLITTLKTCSGDVRTQEPQTTTTVTETTTTTTTIRHYTMDELEVREDKSDGNWYAYAGDEKALTYTGLARNEYGLWYVVNGKVDFQKSGTEYVDGKEYTITQGKVQEAETTTQRVTDSSGVSIEMKEMMDSYESFVDEYVEFMEDYENQDSWSAIARSSSMLAKYSEWAEKIEKMDESDWSTKDWQYYEEVTLRCAQKLNKVAYNYY